jgi:hypothetical protein
MLQARKFLLVLAAVGIAGLWSASASAGCKLIGGTYMCASWITGSEILNATLKGSGTAANGTLYAYVFGTNGHAANDPSCVPSSTNPNPGCAIYGELYCINPAKKSSTAEGQPYAATTTIGATSLVSQNDCTKKGVCTVQVPVELDFTQFNPCQNANWHPVSFIASEFYGLSDYEYLDSQNQTVKVQVLDFCTVNLTDKYNTSKDQMYTCTQVPYQ